MEDRLAEIKNVNTATAASVQEADEMIPDFQKKIQSLQYCLNKVKENNTKIVQLKEKHIKATLSEQEKGFSGELDRLIDENARLCSTVKQDIETLEKDVQKSKQVEPDEPETRIKDISCRSLKAKFVDILRESQTNQVEYKTAVKQKLERQVKIMDPSLNAAQVEEICNDPEGAGNLMASKLIGTGHLKLRNAVADIKDKHKDILKLQRSVETIHQMFVDMAMMVQAQGEMLDNIELNVQEAHNYVKKANVQLAKAKKSHMTAKKWKCCILLSLIIVVVIIVLATTLKK